MFKQHPILSSLTRVAVLGALVATAAPSLADDDDQVVFRFATVGDSREDLAASKFDASSKLGNGQPLVQDVIWGQNTKAFGRILDSAQSQRANLFFENGDMIMGYGRAALPPSTFVPPTPRDYIRKTDLGLFYVEYAFWRGLVAPSFENGMYVVPVAGNHETQCSNGSNGDPNKAQLSTFCPSGKTALSDNENAWRDNMGDLIADIQDNQRFSTVTGVPALNTVGVLAGGTDSPTSAGGVAVGNQQQLSYSFDIQTPKGGPLVHFAVINTDPSGNDSVAPREWLDGDLSAARARGASKFFVFGHKAAWPYVYAVPAGDPAPAPGDQGAKPNDRDLFWQVMAKYNATYFCGHEHTYEVSTHADPTGTYRNTPYQVLVGSGGSPFEMTTLGVGAPATDRYYAWALVEITRNGKVKMSTYGFDENFGATQRILKNVKIQ